MRTVLQLGTWTVRTTLQEGEMHETVNELQKYKTHIATLQESRWPNEGRIEKKDYTLIHCAETNF